MSRPYAALRQLIEHLEHDAHFTAAALHGLWCGRISAGESADSPPGWVYTLRVLTGEEQGGLENPTLESAFQKMREYAMGDLQQEDFSFELWLPEDDAPCSTRLSALADWCRGFLEGLVSVKGDKLDALSDDSRELVQDLMEIGDVDTDLDESEQDEREYLELVEYVKVAVLNIHLDNRMDQKTAPRPTLH